MGGRKYLVGSLLITSVLAGTGAATLMAQTTPGPFPTEEDIARHGFAVWPVDTPEEARAECANAPDWRRDPEEVALRFASEVLGYPEPTTSEDFDSDDEHSYRVLINSRRVKGIFLGSVLEIHRYGECWYVTEGDPREGDRSIDIVTLEGGTKLVVPIGCCGTRVEVGWGEWTQTFEPKERRRDVVVDVPEEAKGRPGHFIVTNFNKRGISQEVGARALPPLPTSEGAVPLTQLDVGRRPTDPRLCRMSRARKEHPERIIRELREWTFSSGLASTNDGYLRYDRSSVRRLGSDFEWRVRLDNADLRFSFSRVAGRCWIIRSVVPNGPPIIEQVAAGNNSFTIDLDPGPAGKVVAYYGVGGESQPVSLAKDRLLGEAFSVARGPDFPANNEGLPAYVLAITYRNGNLYSAEYRLFQMPEG